MDKTITIVTYHYVRDFSKKDVPKVKGLDVDLFLGQLEYINKYYNFITTEDLIEGLHNDGKNIPERSILLTFDDGLIDHYRFVFPLLKENGISGAFFPPARSIKERKILNVHKIHHILEKIDNYSTLVEEIKSGIDRDRSDFELEDYDTYYKRYAQQGRFDHKDVVFIKRMLQKGLPTEYRDKLTDTLFKKFVSKDEVDFSYELYLTVDNICEMNEQGMHIGGHGYNHDWLNVLSSQQQEFEIEQTIEFLNEFNVNMSAWTMCYPFGGYDDRIISKLRDSGCVIGFTVDEGIVTNLSDKPMQLPRIDTNYFPTFAGSEMSQWTKQVIRE